jgi:hypothetical protein
MRITTRPVDYLGHDSSFVPVKSYDNVYTSIDISEKRVYVAAIASHETIIMGLRITSEEANSAANNISRTKPGSKFNGAFQKQEDHISFTPVSSDYIGSKPFVEANYSERVLVYADDTDFEVALLRPDGHRADVVHLPSALVMPKFLTFNRTSTSRKIDISSSLPQKSSDPDTPGNSIYTQLSSLIKRSLKSLKFEKVDRAWNLPTCQVASLLRTVEPRTVTPGRSTCTLSSKGLTCSLGLLGCRMETLQIPLTAVHSH